MSDILHVQHAFILAGIIGKIQTIITMCPTTFQPDISVIIPIYKVEPYIKRCAVSLFEQTADNCEFIFIDDCSPDNSVTLLCNVLTDYPNIKERVKIIRHEKNLGLAGARTTGLDNSQGKYVICCDSDDWVEPQMYKTLYETAVHDDADIVICDYYNNTKSKQTHVSQSVSCNHKALLNQVIRGEIHNGLWNKLIRRDIFDRIYPAFIQGVNMWEDVSVLPRLVYNMQKVSYVPQPLYHYNQANSNAYTQLWKPIYTRNIIDAITVNDSFLKSKGVDVRTLWIRGIYSILYHTHKSQRKEYLNLLFHHVSKSQIDYTVFSTYQKIVAYSLFNRLDIMADCLIFIKKVTGLYR